MIDLWAFLVEGVFGGFHMTVAGLAGLFLIILMIGGVSLLTAMWYDAIFGTVMYMGYGTRLVPALVLLLLLVWFFLQFKGFIDRSGGNY
ncbi:hypothetical protein M0R04_08930 [Candidatus Dojkabacteria bacterium]|nr:hypothetical protein [Candidatus Dojkabacteria bacterium]